ncbi:hypothetical protein AVT69_gp348 [Pseudomonas phage PhiPA3]|uniref:Uncharacterized protein 350 n=1 Tax=Pseudomonas phage PhiPA3 TaxID=998086 RepID=F8SJI4_BPPA3|nr:hypothetical protein AVT69_gp348 [Pseudomonas phage PhiPA3]AEH03773.1 hypothetical protein [Pseudomonas phage PhiPA3]
MSANFKDQKGTKMSAWLVDKVMARIRQFDIQREVEQAAEQPQAIEEVAQQPETKADPTMLEFLRGLDNELPVMEKEENPKKERSTTDMFFEDLKTKAFEMTSYVLRRYMADYTNTQTAPKGKSITFAAVTSITGEVWLGESKDPQAVFNRFKSGKNLPKNLQDLVDDGQKLHIYATAREIDVDSLRRELEDMDVLLARTAPNRRGDVCGYVYVCRHRRTGNYFLKKARGATPNPELVLSMFLGYLNNTKQTYMAHSNKLLHSFVTQNAADCLNKQNFTVDVVAKFNNVDHAIEIMNEFMINSIMGVCLNRGFTRH